MRGEAQKAYGADEAIPPRREVDHMDYTHAVLKEALRKYRWGTTTLNPRTLTTGWVLNRAAGFHAVCAAYAHNLS